jgi:hypothetical protein
MSRLRPSPALVVATVALIVALGGTSYAAFTLPKNSVGTKQLKNNAVTLVKIAPAARHALSKVGPPGPTAGATDPGFGTPSANPKPASSVSATVTTTTTSKLLVTGWTEADIICGASGSCSDTWGLYVDGTPVTGSALRLSAAAGGVNGGFTMTTGLTERLAPGTHKFVFQDDISGDVAFHSSLSPRVTVIALGG